jgi:hypothetical protein
MAAIVISIALHVLVINGLSVANSSDVGSMVASMENKTTVALNE